MRKFCPVCLEEGTKSQIWATANSIHKPLQVEYWDTDGYRHTHEGIAQVTPMLCDKGHTWVETIENGSECSRCGGEWLTRRADGRGSPGSVWVEDIEGRVEKDTTPVEEVPIVDPAVEKI